MKAQSIRNPDELAGKNALPAGRKPPKEAVWRYVEGSKNMETVCMIQCLRFRAPCTYIYISSHSTDRSCHERRATPPCPTAGISGRNLTQQALNCKPPNQKPKTPYHPTPRRGTCLDRNPHGSGLDGAIPGRAQLCRQVSGRV